jgi:hypothetical protein
MTKAESEVMSPQAKENHGLPATPSSPGRGMGQIVLQSLQKEPVLPRPLFQTSSLKSTTEYISVVLSHPACGVLLQPPQDSHSEVKGTRLVQCPL